MRNGDERRRRRLLALGLVAGARFVAVGALRFFASVDALLILGRRLPELLVGGVRVLLVAIVGGLLVSHTTICTPVSLMITSPDVKRTSTGQL